MAARYMTYFMTNDRGKLGLRVQVGHHATSDVDETARDSEGIYRIIIDQGKCPFQIWTFTD